MKCSHCGGLVTWRGPITDLTHTECEGCGRRNCQEPEQGSGETICDCCAAEVPVDDAQTGADGTEWAGCNLCDDCAATNAPATDEGQA